MKLPSPISPGWEIMSLSEAFYHPYACMFPPYSLQEHTPSHISLISAWGGGQTHILRDRSALSSYSPCLENWTLPRNTEHTVDSWEALRLRGHWGHRCRGKTDNGDTHRENDGEELLRVCLCRCNVPLGVQLLLHYLDWRKPPNEHLINVNLRGTLAIAISSKGIQ